MEQGERIRDLRKSLKMTMEQFGEKIGVTKSTISNLENGNRKATEHMIKSICREYNVNYYWLTEGDGEMFIGLPETAIDEVAVEYDLDDFEKGMIVEFLKLTKQERSVLIKYIRSLNDK